MNQKPHISVCVCTYKRPEMLNRLLSNLERQETKGLFEYSISIVDNDQEESARQIVESHARQPKIKVTYDVEPEQNIALARNRTIKNAKGDFICIIDDDEIPDPKWIMKLYNAIICFETDGVLGPVLPFFDKIPPQWVTKGGFFNRINHPDGHFLDWKNSRTGNVLLQRLLFEDNSTWFDPKFGSGGEDRDFFRRKMKEGHLFVWCNNAPVYEIVPPTRWERIALLKKALLRGENAIQYEGSRTKTAFSSMVAIIIYTSCLPIFFFLGHHVFMEFLIKDFDHLGKILGFLGFDWARKKFGRG
jgi:succinoglycan biosynthesis protein ExoM